MKAEIVFSDLVEIASDLRFGNSRSKRSSFISLLNILTYISIFNSTVDFNVKNGQGFKCKYGDPQGCSQEGGNYGGSLSCGVGKKSRIVGGKQARPSEFPWQVGFRWQTRNSRTNIFCGGSLIDKKWVVSAAHCFQNLRRPINELKIVLGEFDVNNEEGNEVVIAARKVSEKV